MSLELIAKLYSFSEVENIEDVCSGELFFSNQNTSEINEKSCSEPENGEHPSKQKVKFGMKCKAKQKTSKRRKKRGTYFSHQKRKCGNAKSKCSRTDTAVNGSIERSVKVEPILITPKTESGVGTEVTNYRCPYCLVKFKNAESFIAHLQTHGEFIKTPKLPTNTESVKVMMTTLPNTPPIRSLPRAKKSTSKIKPIKCDPTNRSRKSKKSANLNEIRKNSGKERHYKCNICGKTILSRQRLEIHVRIHTGEKPFRCNLCSKGFSQSGSLAVHMRLHTGEMPFECSVCSKRFRNSSNLRKHKRSHTGEAPFECSICLRRFVYASSRYIHMRNHSKEKVRRGKPGCQPLSEKGS